VDRPTFLRLGVFLTLFGAGWSLVFFLLNIQDYNYALTIGPSQTQLYIGQIATWYSFAIFVGGAIFSAGLSVLVAYVQPPPERRHSP
jgi:hypothetical protein